MEKLAEIKIEVKNHMSFLQEEELTAFYKHIGFTKPEEVNKSDADKVKRAQTGEANSNQPQEGQAKESKARANKEKKNAPRIIRHTEIIINTKKEPEQTFETKPSPWVSAKKKTPSSSNSAKSSNNKIKNYSVVDSSSGLRLGFVRSVEDDYFRDEKKANAKATKQKVVEDKSLVVSKANDVAGAMKNQNVTEVASGDTVGTVHVEALKDAAVSIKKPAEKGNSDLINKGKESHGQHKSGFQGQDKNRFHKNKKDGKLSYQQADIKNKKPYPSRDNNISKSAVKVSDATNFQPVVKDAGVHRQEPRRNTQGKDIDKEQKREQRQAQRPQNDKSNKFSPHKIILNEKKGVSEVLSEDFILDEFYSDDNLKRGKKPIKGKKEAKKDEKYIPPRAVLTSIKVGDTIIVKDLAERMKKAAAEVIKKLMMLGVMATLNQELDFDTASIVAEEFGIKVEKEVIITEEDILFDEAEEVENGNLQPRAPVVVVMGHVDHGKTSLLDAIRKTNVIEKEEGGITQHIGAYMVKINNRNITFLDTPGHEAFTEMRARGAQATDIAILVVAADDGVMPQTVEAINHAKAANISIIVAINKIDKPGANPDKIKQELTEYGLVSEEWGGDVICVPISAKKGENIDHLLEMVLLVADMLELKANPNRQAKGTVIEAQLDKDRGAIATLLVQRGTLHLGDSVIIGTVFGRIRAMSDDKGHKIKKAGPSTPVEILGLPEVPKAGDTFYAITDEKVAKQLVDKRKQKQREEHLKSSSRVSLDDLFNQIKEGKVKDLNIIVKADVQGSVEAVKQSLTKLSTNEVRVNIIHGGVGAITESDVSLSQVSNAIIIGFNVRPAANVVDIAKEVGVDIRLYRIIYDAIEDIQAAMNGMLDPTYKEVVQGHIEIRQLYKISGVGTIGGAYVLDGKITRNSQVRVVREGIVVFEGKLNSLKRFKDDAREVTQGFECGVMLDKFNDIKEGDIIESFVMEEEKRG